MPLLATAQTERPEWCDPNSRQIIYPDHDYFVGYASGFARSGESIEKATARLKTEAQGDAAQQIQIRVQSASMDAVESAQIRTAQSFDEVIRNNFKRQTETYTDMEIPNLQTKTWYDSKSREVAVVVFVKRRDFMRFYDRQIESLLSKMESALENIANQEQQGQKMKAVKSAEEILQLCPDIEYSQRMISLADPETTAEDLQMDRYTTIVRNLATVIARLKHATAFYIDCQASVGEEKYLLLDKDVRGLLAEKGCHFTDNISEADWIIAIDASIINTAHREGMPYFVYVDGTLLVTNSSTQQKVLESRLSLLEEGHPDGIKGGDYNANKAARIAYRDAARITAESILKFIQN